MSMHVMHVMHLINVMNVYVICVCFASDYTTQLIVNVVRRKLLPDSYRVKPFGVHQVNKVSTAFEGFRKQNI